MSNITQYTPFFGVIIVNWDAFSDVDEDKRTLLKIYWRFLQNIQKT